MSKYKPNYTKKEDFKDVPSLSDAVEMPIHYNEGKVECIEYIHQQLGSSFPSYLEGNVIKYVHRHKYKNSNIQDLRKARWYLSKLIKHYEEL